MHQESHGRENWRARFGRLTHYRPPAERIVGGIAQGLMSAIAAILAYLPTQAFGLGEGYWGSFAAIAVVQTELRATTTSARDQFAGAAIGGAISALTVEFAGEHIVSYVLAVVLSMLACWLLNVATAARLSGTTATIILLVPHHGSPEFMMVSRLAEVAWGLTVAIAVVWVGDKILGALSRKSQ